MVLDTQTVLSIAGAITAIGTAYLTARKVVADSKAATRQQEEELLKKAIEEDSVLKTDLEAKIRALETELENFKSSVTKDIGHLKESYSNEINVLGDKIEELRDQLNSQHSQLLTLLTKLIDER